MNVLQQFINLEYYDICNKIYTYLEHPIVEKANFKKIINECNYLEEDFVDYYFNVVLVDTFYFEDFNDVLVDDFYFEDFNDDGAEKYFLYVL